MHWGGTLHSDTTARDQYCNYVTGNDTQTSPTQRIDGGDGGGGGGKRQIGSRRHECVIPTTVWKVDGAL